MKIAHVTDCYLPQLGGIEIQVHDLAANQIRAGQKVQVLTRTPAGDPDADLDLDLDAGLDQDPRFDHGTVAVRRMPTGLTRRPSASARRELAGMLGGFDAVHVHCSVLSPFAWSVARLASAQAVPTVLTMHSVAPSQRSLLRLSAALGGRPRWPAVWTAVSEVAAAPLRDVLGADAVTILANGIEPEAWQSPVPRPPGGTLTIVSVLRLSLRKRPLALLRTLAAIRASLPASMPLRAVVIGEGPQRSRMERYLRANGMQSWVTLTGRLTRAEIRPLLSAADVYLAPAELESFGIAALEARCAGLPVIAMAAGGVGEFIRNGQEGFLVNSDQEMAAITADLLTSTRLRTMQEHNRRTEPAMTWPRVVGLSLELYQRAGARIEIGSAR